MSRPIAPNKRLQRDIMTLMMSDHPVELTDEGAGGLREVHVTLKGPPDSPFEGGVWRVRVELPSDYPYKSPSIAFTNKVFHPNIHLATGAVCLDVINQAWSPLFDLVNVFDVFLPQLLLYPNPSDPLNAEAAILCARDQNVYEARVREFVVRFASPPCSGGSKGSGGGGSSSGGSGGSLSPAAAAEALGRSSPEEEEAGKQEEEEGESEGGFLTSSSEEEED